jgi:hypothetical protein
LGGGSGVMRKSVQNFTTQQTLQNVANSDIKILEEEKVIIAQPNDLYEMQNPLAEENDG